MPLQNPDILLSQRLSSLYTKIKLYLRISNWSKKTRILVAIFTFFPLFSFLTISHLFYFMSLLSPLLNSKKKKKKKINFFFFFFFFFLFFFFCAPPPLFFFGLVEVEKSEIFATLK